METKQKQGQMLSQVMSSLFHFGHKKVTARVDELKETTKKDEAGNMFTILKEEAAGE